MRYNLFGAGRADTLFLLCPSQIDATVIGKHEDLHKVPNWRFIEQTNIGRLMTLKVNGMLVHADVWERGNNKPKRIIVKTKDGRKLWVRLILFAQGKEEGEKMTK